MRIVIVDSEETSREVIKQAINTVVETHKIKSGCKIVGERQTDGKGVRYRERTPGSYYHGS